MTKKIELFKKLGCFFVSGLKAFILCWLTSQIPLLTTTSCFFRWKRSILKVILIMELLNYGTSWFWTEHQATEIIFNMWTFGGNGGELCKFRARTCNFTWYCVELLEWWRRKSLNIHRNVAWAPGYGV